VAVCPGPSTAVRDTLALMSQPTLSLRVRVMPKILQASDSFPTDDDTCANCFGRPLHADVAERGADSLAFPLSIVAASSRRSAALSPR
jgi:hypothetical protein